MSKITYLVIFTLSSLFSRAQTWEWAEQSKGGSGSGVAITGDNKGNVYTIIASEGYITYGSDTMNTESVLAKHDNLGKVLWVVSLNGARVYGISADTSGNCYVTGAVWNGAVLHGVSNSMSVASTGGYDAFISKYDTNGTILWAKTWGYPDAGEGGVTIKTDEGGSSYVSGSGSKSVPYGDGYFIITKFDTQGNMLWSYDSNWLGKARPIIADLDKNGDYYITGIFFGSAYFGDLILTADPGTQTIFIVKYNKDGKMIWARKNGAAYGESNGICLDGKGHLYLNGLGANGITFENITLTSPIPPGGMFIVKYDTSGNVIWAKRENVKFGRGIDCDTAGNIFVTGVIQPSYTPGPSPLTSLATGTLGSGANTVVLNSKKPGDFFVAKYDEEGNLKWATMPGGNLGVANWSNFIYVNNKNECLVTGQFSGNVIFDSVTVNCPIAALGINNDSFIAKLKDSLVVSTIGIKVEGLKKNELSVFPNPTSNIFTISFISAQTVSQLQINVIDISGKTVYTETIKAFNGSLKKEINLSGISKGTYFIKLSSHEFIETKKIVVE